MKAWKMGTFFIWLSISSWIVTWWRWPFVIIVAFWIAIFPRRKVFPKTRTFLGRIALFPWWTATAIPRLSGPFLPPVISGAITLMWLIAKLVLPLEVGGVFVGRGVIPPKGGRQCKHFVGRHGYPTFEMHESSTFRFCLVCGHESSTYESSTFRFWWQLIFRRCQLMSVTFLTVSSNQIKFIYHA